VYVVDLWGTWCPPCLADIPHMKKVADQYRGRGVVFAAIAISPEYGTPVAEFVRGKGDLMPYTVGEDVGDRIDQTWADPRGGSGAGSYPTLAIIDRDGRIAFVGRGYPIQGFEETLAKVVEGKWDLADAVAKDKSVAQVKQLAEPLLADAKRRLGEGDVAGALDVYRRVLGMNAGSFGMRAAGLYPTIRDRVSKQAANAWALELMGKWFGGVDERLAWPLATLAESIVYLPDPASSLRPDLDDSDFVLALRAASRANEVAHGKDPWRLQTLSKVTYASGDKKRAAELMTRSVEAAKAAEWGADELVKLEAMRDKMQAAQ